MPHAATAASTTSAFQLPRAPHRRKTYAERTAQGCRAAKIASSALSDRPAVVEDADGHLIPDWSKYQGRLTNDDFILGVKHQRAVEHEELLEVVSPGVIKYALAQKWLVKAQPGGFYLVTTIARDHHKLPLRDRDGRKIAFLPAVK